jgi:glycogen synthase
MTPRQPRKVLMTADCIGGVWNYCLQLIEEFVPHGIEVLLAVFGGLASADQRRATLPLPNLRLVEPDLKLEWMPESAVDLHRAGHLLRQLEAEFAPDIVHINGYANAAAGFAAPVVAVAHSCVPTWWRACRGREVPPEWAGYRRRLRNGVAAADCVVAPSSAYLREFIAANGRPRWAQVIHNGRDPARYRPAPKQPLVLAAGRLWDEAKNIRVLCRAAAELPCSVLIAGDGSPNVPLPPNVRLLGRLDAPRLATRMSEAAVFAAPARYEPFGLAVLEAALSGCALVLADIPTMRELWENAATFVAPDDAAGWAEALQWLVTDPASARVAGRAARDRALGYSASAMARGYVALYAELLAPAAPRAAEGRAA